jgi:hypothetical protein
MRILLVLGVCLLMGCPSAKFPDITSRVGARTVLVLVANAVRAGADTCLDKVKEDAATASEKNDPALLAATIKFGDTCRDILLPIQHSVLDAADLVDAWTDTTDDIAMGRVACAVKSFIDGGKTLEKLLADNKVLPPAEYNDAKAITDTMASFANGACK